MANEHLKRTPTSTGNKRVLTWSGWVKRHKLSNAYVGSQNFFRASNGSGGDCGWRFDYSTPSDSLRVHLNGSSAGNVQGDAKHRDPSSWMHVMLSFNSTLEQSSARVHMYIDGVLMPDNNTGYPAQNFETSWNDLVPQYIGTYDGSTEFFHGEMCDIFMVDGQALTPDVFGFYKEGKGYQSSGTQRATDFRPGQWSPKAPRTIKTEINRRGGFGTNGFYLPMNDSSNFGADFSTTPNSIITLKGEDLPQPRNGAPTTTDSYVSQLRTDDNASNLVLAIPGITGGQGSAYGDYSADIKGSGSNKTITAYGNAGVAVTASYYGSAMQFDGTGDYFSVPNSSDLRFTSEDFTIETWFNTNSLTDDQFIFSQWNVTDNRRSYVLWLDSGVLKFNGSTDGSGSDNGNVTNTISVGANQWNHAAFSREGTTTRLFLNGVCIGINTNTQDFYNNTTDAPRIGGEGGTGTREFDGYIQDLRIYKGVAKYTDGFDVPKPYAPVGIGTWRAVSDTCKNNFATLNPLDAVTDNQSGTDYTQATHSNGNLTVILSDDFSSARGSIGISTGKYYWEIRVDDNTNSPGMGVIAPGNQLTSYSAGANSASYEPRADRFRKNGVNFYDGTNNKTDDGLIVGVALDKNVGIISFFADGTLLSDGTMTGLNALSDVHIPECFTYNDGSNVDNTYTWNFGQNPTFSGQVTAGTYADDSGKGLFKYAPPTGFLALCEDNLPTPAIADPGEHFKTVLWTGDGSAGRSITGVGFKPDLVWIKERSSTSAHALFDSVRGAGFRLVTNSTNGEDHTSTNVYNPSFDNDGFTVGTDGAVNQDGQTYVAWCWKAGGPAVSNTDGSITSQVSVNQDAGFSIVSYTGTGANATVGHGLDKTPNIVLCKTRPDVTNWSFNGNVAGLTYGTNKMMLQATGGIVADTNEVMSANATTFSVGNSTATNGTADAMIAYCWAEIEGYSKFGSYTGNGSVAGPFVYCGFKPAFLMIKRTDTSGEWWMYDSSRGPTNPIPRMLLANGGGDENEDSASYLLDFVSNGFKWRSGLDASNGDGGSFLFMAFAESPFQTANAK